MTEITGDARFKAADGVDVTEVPDGFVIYDEARDIVHYLNPTAAVAFTACDGTRSLEEIRAFLCDAYEVDVELSLESLFAQLETSGLVCRVA